MRIVKNLHRVVRVDLVPENQFRLWNLEGLWKHVSHCRDLGGEWKLFIETVFAKKRTSSSCQFKSYVVVQWLVQLPIVFRFFLLLLHFIHVLLSQRLERVAVQLNQSKDARVVLSCPFVELFNFVNIVLNPELRKVFFKRTPQVVKLTILPFIFLQFTSIDNLCQWTFRNYPLSDIGLS